MVLTYDAYNEDTEKQQDKDKEIQLLKERQSEMEKKFQMILEKIDTAKLT
jgi:hypothetical protein